MCSVSCRRRNATNQPICEKTSPDSLFECFFVFVNIRLTINYIQENTANDLFTTFKAEWRK